MKYSNHLKGLAVLNNKAPRIQADVYHGLWKALSFRMEPNFVVNIKVISIMAR